MRRPGLCSASVRAQVRAQAKPLFCQKLLGQTEPRLGLLAAHLSSVPSTLYSVQISVGPGWDVAWLNLFPVPVSGVGAAWRHGELPNAAP